MIEIIFNKKTRRFSVQYRGLDSNNWESSYFQLIKESEEELSKLDSSFSKRYNYKTEFLVSLYAEIGYYVLHGFASKLKWTYQYINAGKQSDEMSKACKHSLKQIDSFIKQLINNDLTGSHKYTKDKKKTGNRYFRINNFNRFVFKYDPVYNKVKILKVLFHHEDKLDGSGNYSKWMKEILVDSFNSFIESDNEFTHLSDRISKLKSKYDR